jgi:hypothetical protein
MLNNALIEAKIAATKPETSPQPAMDEVM